MRALAFVAALISCVAFAPAQAVVSAEQVQQSLRRGCDWLYSTQREDGTWEKGNAPNPGGRENDHDGGQFGGRTALAVYALLASGEKHDDPRLTKAIDFLKRTEITGVYAVAMRMLAFSFLPQTDEVKRLIGRDAQLMLRMVKTQGRAAGHYDYTPRVRGTNTYSHSRSQYGALGMWVAAQTGFEIPQNYWALVERGWVANQDASGGWTYTHAADNSRNLPLTPGMTAAGIATLFITNDFLYSRQGLDCRGNVNNPAIDKGLAWMAKNMDKVATDVRYDRDFPYVSLYAIERIGVASGLKYIGDVDWYSKGAAWIVGKQNTNGSWTGTGGSFVDTHADSCFAMLFLARGRAPVVFNKLQYDLPEPRGNNRREANWNQRPRDIANAVKWIGRQVERDLNWQIVPIDRPLRDMHDAPMLFISGNQALNFTDEQKAKLRDYALQGGIIIGHADCRAQQFSKSFVELGGQLFGEQGYEFRELEESSPIYTNQAFPRSAWKRKPSVQALSNGTRELMILIARDDAGRDWQQDDKRNPEVWELAANLYLYAVDKRNFQFKGQTYLVDKRDAVKSERSLKLARLQYNGTWNPEPAGWHRLANVLHNNDKLDLQIETVKLGEGALADFKIAHLTGTREFRLEPAEREALKAFIGNGGTLLIDAAGGSTAFASAAEAELRQLYPSINGEIIPASDPLFASLETGWRLFARQKIGGLSTPRLRAFTIDGRRAIYYSAEDLSTGLMGAPIDGIVGYDATTATEITRRLILQAAK